jgi:branched-chain amino acid transport system substrate-binding protein
MELLVFERCCRTGRKEAINGNGRDLGRFTDLKDGKEKKTMKLFKKAFALLIALMLILSFAACQQETKPAAADNNTSSNAGSAPANQAPAAASDTVIIDIASIGPITGNYSLYGSNIAAAIELCVKDINDNGGIKSMGGAQLRVQAYDDAGDPNQAVVAANKLLTDKNYAVVLGPWATACGLAMKPLFNDAKVPLISPSVTTAAFAEDKDDYCFAMAMNMVQEEAAQAKFIKETLGKTKAIVFTPNHENGKSMFENFEKFFTQAGGTVVDKEFFEVGTKDFRPQLTRMMDTDAEVILLCGGLGDLSVLVNQLREVGINVPLQSGYTLFTQDYLDIVGNNADGQIIMAFYSPDRSNPEAFERFRDAFTATGRNLDPQSFLAADATYLVRDLLEEMGSKGVKPDDTDAIRQYIFENLPNRQGIQGLVTTYQFDEVGQSTREFTPVLIENGEFKAFGK